MFNHVLQPTRPSCFGWQSTRLVGWVVARGSSVVITRIVKVTISLLAMGLFLGGCGHRTEANSGRNLQGTWVLKRVGADGSFHSQITITTNGNYVCQNIQRDNSNHVYTFQLKGTFQLSDGYLIDTVTNHSDTNFAVPSVFRAKIVRISDGELVVHDETNSVDAVFRKVKQ